jgi:uncharacterized membrane protein
MSGLVTELKHFINTNLMPLTSATLFTMPKIARLFSRLLLIYGCIFKNYYFIEKQYSSTDNTRVMETTEIQEMFEAQNAQLQKLHAIVAKTIEEEGLIVNNLKNPPQEILSRGQKISDKVARFGGSWKFIIIFASVLIVWILFNTLAVTVLRFDPYPYILMNLVLSCIAALQAPIIMMSQNRQEEKDRMRAENDYMVNLKAELEVRSLHEKIDLLLEEQIKTLYTIQEKQFNLLNGLSIKMDGLCENLAAQKKSSD